MSNSYEEIRRLMYEYAECVDLADFEGLARLFAHGQMRSNTADGGMSGEAVRDFYAATNRVHSDGTLRTRHLATNIIIDLDEAGASASARSYFLVLQATVNLPLQPIVAGRYHDRFERADGTWRFIERMVLVDQVGNMSEHLTFDIATERVDLSAIVKPPA
jgi:3-phenylpropionate/cinnamic acid dioxygenase small subunit